MYLVINGYCITEDRAIPISEAEKQGLLTQINNEEEDCE